MSLELISISRQETPDEDPDLSYLTDKYRYDSESETDKIGYLADDSKRLEAYHNDEWHMIGVHAVAKIRINGAPQEITSGGIWSIESDSDEEYLDEVYQDELADLGDQLISIGFNDEQIDEALN